MKDFEINLKNGMENIAASKNIPISACITVRNWGKGSFIKIQYSNWDKKIAGMVKIGLKQ